MIIDISANVASSVETRAKSLNSLFALLRMFQSANHNTRKAPFIDVVFNSFSRFFSFCQGPMGPIGSPGQPGIPGVKVRFTIYGF